MAGAKVGKEAPSSFKIIGCHTDSPCFKLAPMTKVEKFGYRQINVMTYGGGLWRTWLDRDLILAGKIIVKENEKLVAKYWKSDRALISIPSLCIHLDRMDEFNPNKETHLKPIMSMAIVDQLFGEGVQPLANDVYNLDKNHWNTLTSLISTDLGIERDAIVDFELSLADA